MSVDLYVTWKDGTKESRPLAPQRTAEVVWTEKGKELDLKLYDGMFPCYFFEDNLEQWIFETERLQGKMLVDNLPELAERLGYLLEFLYRMRKEGFLKASMG